MFNLGLIKSGVQIITGLGAGYIADNAINMVKPKAFTGAKKVLVNVGGWILSAMVADAATTYVETKWDEAEESIKELIGPKEKEEVTEE